MQAGRWLLLMTTALALVDCAAGQFRVLPPAPPIAPRDAFHHRRGRVVFSGIVPGGYFGPPIGFAPGGLGPAGLAPVRFASSGFIYGVLEPRVSVHVIVPESVLPPGRLPPAIDLSGVDLDVAPPPWAREGELPRRGVPAVVPPRPEPEQVAKIEPPKKEAVPPARKLFEPPPPQADLVLESWQLAARGVEAFQENEYGLAAQRFQQAIETDPAAARPHFLLGQAYLALGKFREAVQVIGVGLAKDPTWPRSDFRPRVDLYMNQADRDRHIARLEQVQAAQPQHAGHLFLLAYTRWFDDDRAAATRLFREVRPLVADPQLVDLFLK